MSYKIQVLINMLKELKEKHHIVQSVCESYMCNTPDYNCGECPFKNTETLPALIRELETLNEGG